MTFNYIAQCGIDLYHLQNIMLIAVIICSLIHKTHIIQFQLLRIIASKTNVFCLGFIWLLALLLCNNILNHYSNVIMGTMASQITSLTIVYSTVYSDVDQRKHQISASLIFVRGFHWGLANSPHNWPVTRKMFPFDVVIMLEAVIDMYSLKMMQHAPEVNRESMQKWYNFI